VGSQETTAKTAQKKGQQKLFVGHVGEDCVYMAQEVQRDHKTNRDWQLDTSSSDNSNNSMNMEDTNTNGNNNNNIICADNGEIEEYEPTDSGNFEAQITNIASWTHEDLVHNTVIGACYFMTYWEMHSYHWYCYICNQQLVSTGTATWDWECPTCNYLETSLGDNEAHWDFGVCGSCNTIVSAEVACVTCLLNQGVGIVQPHL
jgi:hypothetical protein